MASGATCRALALLLGGSGVAQLASRRGSGRLEGATSHHGYALNRPSLEEAPGWRSTPTEAPSAGAGSKPRLPAGLSPPPPASAGGPGVAFLADCLCEKNKRVKDCTLSNGECKCVSWGSDVTVSCSTLTSKCLLMKAEVTSLQGRKIPREAFVDNDGIYNPECDSNGNFKAKQCNGTSTCWCVNSAGVRRTEKSESNITCDEVVRTSWIIIETKPVNTDLDTPSVERAFTDALAQRYLLNPKHISVMYENSYITIELKQNASEKSPRDVDIADVAYYFEKDVKGDSIPAGSRWNITVQGQPLQLQDTLIYYVDEKPPEFSMKHLTTGVIAVIVVVALAVVAGILVLVFTRRKRGKYEKAEVKEMNEMHRELKS